MTPSAKLSLLALALLTAAPAAGAHEVCTILADANTGAVVHERGQCDGRVTPASTFKIAISLMGFDAEVLRDEHTPALPFKDGYPAWRDNWRQTTDPTLWIRNSVVWYSQQVTQALGAEDFRRYVNLFGYGNRDVSGTPGKNDGLTTAWLSSSLRISPREQIGFLSKLVHRAWPLSPRAYAMTARILRIDARPGGWTIRGKTGAGFPMGADGTADRAHGYGWFVGWAAREDRVIVFARLIQDDRPEAEPAGFRARDSLLKDFPGLAQNGPTPR